MPRITPPLARLFLLGLILAALPPVTVSAAEFPLKDGDTWVMAGDSITAQHLHSNYFEAFCFARYPKLTFRFRNSGVGGHTIPTTLARFGYDIAAWKPTVVSVELGMNDQGGYTVEQYLANMGKFAERVKALKARPVYFTASPINNGDTMAKLGGNTRLHQYAVALKKFAAEQESPFADQFHALLDVWGKNKPREMLARDLHWLKAAAEDKTLIGAEHLQAFLAAQAKSGKPLVSMGGDPVHPGPNGQLMMAVALLKELGATPFVSSVNIDAGGRVEDAKGCAVDAIKASDGKLSFDRVDECLPVPVPGQARDVVSLDPTILEMSQYTLKVTGLKGQKYALKINGQMTATLTAQELAKGVNLTAFRQGPIAKQGSAILAAVNAKEGLVGQWRGLSRLASSGKVPQDTTEKLAELTKKVEAADAKIRMAARPQKLHFKLTEVQ